MISSSIANVSSAFRQMVQKRRVLKLAEKSEDLRIHFGCGPDYLEGYINVDIDPNTKADLHAQSLSFLPDSSVTTIECYHVFEHFDLIEAHETLLEWHRIIRPEGTVILELPNLEVCAREIGKHFDDQGYDLAMAGIFSYPPFVREFGMPMIHKWGWTPATLTAALLNAGFTRAWEQSVKQTWRVASAFNRDMQIVGQK